MRKWAVMQQCNTFEIKKPYTCMLLAHSCIPGITVNS